MTRCRGSRAYPKKSVMDAVSTSFGDYIVHVDESGDHGMINIDPFYPVFVLVFCIFEKAAYSDEVCPAVQKLKFKHFGEDTAVLHERDIRKAQKRFSLLADPAKRADFIAEVCALVEIVPFTVIAIVIRKDLHKAQYSAPSSPYELALEMGLERVCRELEKRGQKGKLTHVVFECRGKKEDRELELEFRRVVAHNADCQRTPVEIVMCDKRGNAAGLQIADLIAGPIGAKVLHPARRQRGYEVVRPKFRVGSGGVVLGYGLKIFPTGDLSGLP